MRKSRTLLPLLLLILGCETDSGSSEDDCHISQIALYQGVKIPLMAGGEASADRTVPVIKGRDALMRVFVETGPGFEPRSMAVQVALESATAELSPLVVERFVESDSTEADLDTTFNIYLPGAVMRGDLRFSVSLRDVSNPLDEVPARTVSKWPSDGGTEPFLAAGSGTPLAIVLIPVSYSADGSGRAPDLSDEQVARFRDRFFALYPVPVVEVTVGGAITWDRAVESAGDGWSSLLGAIQAERERRGARPNEYIYGLVNPGSTFADYCGPGCVTGYSSLAVEAGDHWAKAGVGLGYTGPTAADIMVHEIGHAHGLMHAPCGFEDLPTDPLFPYGDGLIGVWGYDLVTGELKPPSSHADFMGDCRDPWVSDYHYRALFERIEEIHSYDKIADGR